MKLLLVVAHPDDEAFGCGSVLAHAADKGYAATVLCATRGELGEPAPGCGIDRSQLASAREAELREACSVLGVKDVRLLDWIDSGVDGEAAPGSLVSADVATVAGQVQAVIDDIDPDVVVTLDASDGHRDHAAIRDATLIAVGRASRPPARVYLCCLARSLMTEFTGLDSLGTPDEELTTLVDVSAQLDRRWAAMRAHRSQLPPYSAMSPSLQRRFLGTDHMRRLRPAWAGGPVETDWRPSHSELVARYQVHAHASTCWWDLNQARWECRSPSS